MASQGQVLGSEPGGRVWLEPTPLVLSEGLGVKETTSPGDSQAAWRRMKSLSCGHHPLPTQRERQHVTGGIVIVVGLPSREGN